MFYQTLKLADPIALPLFAPLVLVREGRILDSFWTQRSGSVEPIRQSTGESVQPCGVIFWSDRFAIAGVNAVRTKPPGGGRFA